MTHTRIRKFNTSDTYPDQNLDNDLCQAVVRRWQDVWLRGSARKTLMMSKTSPALILWSRLIRSCKISVN